MSYGFIVRNANNRVQIDSNTAYPTLYQSGGATINSDDNVTFSSISNSADSLVFARPVATSGEYGIFRGVNDYVKSASGSQIEYRTYRETTAGLVTPTSGYGLNIFNSSGSPIYSATSSSYNFNMDIVAAGTFGFGTSTSFDIPMTSSTYALSTGRIYILLNPAIYLEDTATLFYYQYLFGEGAYGTIRVYALKIDVNVYLDYNYNVTVIVSQAPASIGNTYMIGYLRG